MTPTPLLLLLAALSSTSSTSDVTAPVRRLQAALQAADRTELRAVVGETHAGGALVAAASGDAAPPEGERAALESALLDLATARLEAGFEAGGSFGEPTPLGGDQDRATVGATFREPGGDEVPVRYELVPVGPEGEAWGIAEVRLDDEPRYDLAARFASRGLAGDALLAAVESAVRRYRETPVDVVRRLQAGLIDVMRRAGELGFAGRYAALEELVTDTHDLDAIARLAVGDAWNEASEEQRDELRRRFRRLSVATYAARFDGYSGERFEITGDEATRRGGWVVRSRLVKADGGAVVFEHQFRRKDGRWSILNIVVDGASDLAIKRAEYAQVIAAHGFDGLLAELEEQTRRYEAGGGD